MTDNINAGYRSLAQASETANFSPEGAAWIAGVFDKFQDRQTVEVGIPDGLAAKSIVQTFTQQVSISKTSLWGVDADANSTWDLQITMLPFLQNVSAQGGHFGALLAAGPPAVRMNGVLYPAVADFQANIGSFTVSAKQGSAATSPMWPDYNSFVTPVIQNNAAKHYDAYSPADSLYRNLDIRMCRVVGQAFEVVNTTAELYRNGSVTTYRINTVNDQAPVWMKHGRVPENTCAYHLTNWFACPAPDASAVQNLPLTQTWNAGAGCYCVAAFDPKVMCDFTGYPDCIIPVGQNNLWLYATPSVSLSDMCNVICCDPNAPATVVPLGDATDASILQFGNRPTGLQTSGAIFTELSPQSTFRLTMKITVEFIPEVYDSSITLARAPSLRDDNVLEVYARSLRALPPGCPVGLNPFGEWFRSVMDIVAANAAIIGGAISAALVGDPSSGALVGSALGRAWGTGTKGMSRAF